MPGMGKGRDAHIFLTSSVYIIRIITSGRRSKYMRQQMVVFNAII